MATILPPPTHVEAEKVLMHIRLYLKHFSLFGRVCTVCFQRNNSNELRLILRIL